MFCIFLIEGSEFSKKIPKKGEWSKILAKDFIVVRASFAKLELLERQCIETMKKYSTQHENLKFGVIGLSSGGYFALRLKKKISKLQFCIAISPVIDPIYRYNHLKNMQKNNPELDYVSILDNTPQVRKIYNTIDNNTLIITGDNDIQVPLEMFRHYKIKNFIVLKNTDHSITTTPPKSLISMIKDFILC